MRRAAGLVGVLAAALSPGCGGPSPSTDPGNGEIPPMELASQGGAFHLVVVSDPNPPVRGTDRFVYTVTDATTGAAQDGLGLEVRPWMPAHGHGTSVVPTVTPLGQGRYQIDNAYLFMAGTWQLRTTITGAVTDAATPSYDVP